MATDRRITFIINGSPIGSPLSPRGRDQPLATKASEPEVQTQRPRRLPRPRKKRSLCCRARPPMIGCRRVAIDVLNGLIFLLSIIMFYTAMGSLAHMDVNDLLIDPFMYVAVLASLISLFVSILGCQTPRRRRPLRLTLYIAFTVVTSVCFLVSAVEISQFKAIVQAIADHDGNYYDTHPEAEAHDYLVRYQRGFMKLWELAECVGGGCSTFDCSEEDPLHFQSVLCPMDTNFQTYLESLFLIANAELSDEFIMECRQWLIAEGQGPIPPPDTDPIAPEVADPYGTSVITSDDLLSDLSGNVNSWCRVRTIVVESPLGGITACIWLAGLLAILQLLTLTTVMVLELTDRLKLADSVAKRAPLKRLINSKETQDPAELV